MEECGKKLPALLCSNKSPTSRTQLVVEELLYQVTVASLCPNLHTNQKKQYMLAQVCYIIEGSLEVKLLAIWRDEKTVSREKSQKRKDQKKEDAGARKGRKVAKHCVFSWFCGSGGLKSRLAKAAGAETSGEMRDEKLHAVVARSTFGSKMC